MYAYVLIEGEKFGLRHTHRHIQGEHHVKVKAEIKVTHLQAEKHQTLQLTTRSWEGSPGQSQLTEGPTPANRVILDSSLQDSERRHFLLFKPPSQWYFVMTAPESE